MTPTTDKPPILRFLFLFACLVAAALWLASLSESHDTSAGTVAEASGDLVTPELNAFALK